MEKKLRQLLATWATAVAGTDLPQPPACDGPDIALTELVEHTDYVKPGAAFVARVRAGSDGHRFVRQAYDKGASLIIGERPLGDLDLPADAPYWQVGDTAETMAYLAAAWHGFPGRELVIVGVTGTDGKSSVTAMIFQILRQADFSVGMVSTIKAAVNDQEEPLALHVTTPEAPVVQAHLRRMADVGVTHCVLETTSHGLAQRRVAAVPYDIAVVTNITHEHLDYHGSYEGYLAAKSRLFSALQEQWTGLSGMKTAVTRTAVLNQDDGSYNPLRAIATPRQFSYGLQEAADIFPRKVQFRPSGIAFDLCLPDGDQRPVESVLVGDFNLYNMLAAAGAAYALGIEAEKIVAGLAAVQAISGRMERIDRGQPFQVVVDFAHTPISLVKAIRAVREMTPGRIIAVFGSAGKRDVAKRRLMAEASAREADLSVLTAEDPRTDSLDEILEMMADGCRSQGGVEGKTFWRVPDRGRAIYHALSLAQPDDLVLICGKGHEQSMCFGEIEYPWDDRQATRAALDAFLAGAPPPDLGLPTYWSDERPRTNDQRPRTNDQRPTTNDQGPTTNDE